MRDGVYRESGVIESIPPGGLNVRWRARIGQGYSGPAIADGQVFVTDRLRNPDRERIMCLADSDGSMIWNYMHPCEYSEMEYGNGPRATPTVHEGLVYAFGTKGHLSCLDARTGTLIWEKDSVKEFDAVIPRYGASAAPLVEGDFLIAVVGGKPDGTVVAFDRRTGEERWRALDDRPAYSAPIVIERGHSRQLVVWTADAIHSLDPMTGNSYWQIPFESSWDPAQAIGTPVLHGNQLLIVMGWNRGAVLLQLDTEKPAATTIWQTESQPSNSMSTPVFVDDTSFLTLDMMRGLCLSDAANGEQIWADERPKGGRHGHAHITPHEDRLFLFNQGGHLLMGRADREGLEILGDTLLVEPTAGFRAGGPVAWAHPAYANQSIYVRNDRELVCASLAAADYEGTPLTEPHSPIESRVLDGFVGMSAANALAFSPDGSTLAVGTQGGKVKRIDPKTGDEAPENRRDRRKQRNRIASVAWSPDGRMLAASGGTEFFQGSNNYQTSGYVLRWEAPDFEELPGLEGITIDMLSIAFSPDSSRLVTGGADSLVRLWDAKSGEPLATFSGHTDAVWSVAFSPDGKSILSAGYDRTLRLWDSDTRGPIAVLEGHEEEILAVAVSPDGRLAATGSADWTVRLWDLEAKQQVALLSGHQGGVYCLAFTPDGKTLISGSGDETVKLWNVSNGTLKTTLRGHTSGVRSLAISPDGTLLATSGRDDTIRLWSLD